MVFWLLDLIVCLDSCILICLSVCSVSDFSFIFFSVSSSDLNPQETLLHFAARRGLYRVMCFLLQQPGAREALQLVNREGQTPSAIAVFRGHERLHELLTK